MFATLAQVINNSAHGPPISSKASTNNRDGPLATVEIGEPSVMETFMMRPGCSPLSSSTMTFHSACASLRECPGASLPKSSSLADWLRKIS
jgi:hypothetical protein